MWTCDDRLQEQWVINAVARLFQLQAFIVHPIGPVDGAGCAPLVTGHVEKSVLWFDCLRMTCEAVTWRNKGKEVAGWENIQEKSFKEIIIIAQWAIEIPFWWVVRWSRRSDTISSLKEEGVVQFSWRSAGLPLHGELRSWQSRRVGVGSVAVPGRGWVRRGLCPALHIGNVEGCFSNRR